VTGLSTKVRRQVADRDRGTCLRCGARGTNVQHRIGRGMGGTSRSDVSELAALVTLCGSGTTGCHGHITTHPEESYATGWAIRRSDATPASEIPLTDLHGSRFFLTEEGDIVPVDGWPIWALSGLEQRPGGVL
jgi:hypothetical protein